MAEHDQNLAKASTRANANANTKASTKANAKANKLAGKSASKSGVEVIQDAAQTMADKPGCYLMYGEGGVLLYVGKARRLKRRVRSYTKPSRLTVRMQRMVHQVKSLEVMLTSSESQALLQESVLIKQHKPRYNILMRDDKRLPHIRITTGHEYPRVLKYRGQKQDEGIYFGPFASTGAVNEAVNSIQRLFRLRDCSDNVFSNRSRPCLQYQIKRCCAPCVGYVTKEAYGNRVAQAHDFLSGKASAIQEGMELEMRKASEERRYEVAGELRDRLRSMGHVLGEQLVQNDQIGDLDIISVVREGDMFCIGQSFWRLGSNYGVRTLPPKRVADATEQEIVAALVGQFYSRYPATARILVSHLPQGQLELEAMLSKRAQRKVRFQRPQRGRLLKLLEQVAENASDRLRQHWLDVTTNAGYMKELGQLLGMKNSVKRIEVYDNSHLSGTFATSARVVFGSEGFEPNNYRIYNLGSAQSNSSQSNSSQADSSDDYAMMREVMRRRLARSVAARKTLAEADSLKANDAPDKDALQVSATPKMSEDLARDAVLPDVMLIDGGQAHRNVVLGVLEEFSLSDKIEVMSIAKGRDRKDAVFYTAMREGFRLDDNEGLRFFLERLRDEVHRFVITRHRRARSKSLTVSRLDKLKGIGDKRRRAILAHFGTVRMVAGASVADLAKVPGVSEAMAKDILEQLND